MAATPYPAYRGLSQAHTSQARAGAAPPGKISNTVPVISPGGGCRLARPTGPLTGSNLAGPRKRSAAGQDIRHGICNSAGWRLSPYPAYRVLSQAQTSQARASAAPAGQDIRHGSCNFAERRLRLARPTGASHRLKPRRPAQAQRPPGKISGTVPVISPGGGCRLTRPTGSSNRLIPRRPAQAQRRRA